ncbi:MAG: ATP-binding protein, partial [Chitinophagaceae bacterium]
MAEFLKLITFPPNIIMIIGRKEELKELQSVAAARSSSFVAVYGRRRVGKTFLIRNAFNNNFDFSI